jgi:uncharacterized membrane protein YgdD (TMEM256/DUF423 family)
MRGWILVGGLVGFLGVGLGAFGAHGLEEHATGEALDWWDTAVRYHLVHAVLLVVIGSLGGRDRLVALAGWALSLGVLVFCGTLYAMALGGPRWLGAVTPVGGLGLMGGWLAVALLARRPDPSVR